MSEQPKSLEELVTAVVAKVQDLPPETVTLDKTFADLGIDSLDGINILFAIEEEFGIVVPDEIARGMTSVQQMVDGLRPLWNERRAGKSPEPA